MHGGKSTGPRSPEGKARSIAAHTKHGRRSRAHVALVREINAKLQKITYKFLKGVKASARIFVALRLGKRLPNISFNVIHGNAPAFVVVGEEAS